MQEKIKELLGKSTYEFEDLLTVMTILRSDEGCPWDREQTHESIKMDTIEEAYELVEAIDNKDHENLKEELGDLLLHVVFHSQIAKDENRYTVDDVIQGIVTKMIRRHPHVFADSSAENAEEVLVNWESIKEVEKKNPTISEEMLMVPKALPALIRSRKVQKKAAKVGFDFESGKEAFKKVHEEVAELEEAIDLGNKAHIEEEYGDLLFAIVNISRFFGLNAEMSLTNATEKFINRFRGVEELANSQGKKLSEMTLEEMDQLWNKCKTNQK